MGSPVVHLFEIADSLLDQCRILLEQKVLECNGVNRGLFEGVSGGPFVSSRGDG